MKIKLEKKVEGLNDEIWYLVWVDSSCRLATKDIEEANEMYEKIKLKVASQKFDCYTILKEETL